MTRVIPFSLPPEIVYIRRRQANRPMMGLIISNVRVYRAGVDIGRCEAINKSNQAGKLCSVPDLIRYPISNIKCPRKELNLLPSA